MRCYSSSGGRITTLFSVLIFVSFALAFAAPQAAHRGAVKRTLLERANVPVPPLNTTTTTTTSTSTTSSSSSTTSSLLSSTTTSTVHSTTTHSSATTTSSTQSPTTSSTTSTSTSSSPSSSSTSSKTSTSTTLSSTSTSTETTTSSTTTTTSSTQSATLLVVTGIPSTISGANTASVPLQFPGGTGTGTSDPADETDTTDDGDAAASATKTGFFSNKGEVAAVFTIVAIIGCAAVACLALRLRRKRRSADHDIFESEYKEYVRSSNDRDFEGNSGVADTSSLSLNSASLAGAQPLQHADYNSNDTAYNLDFAQPTDGTASNRTSTMSNHAGYGAFKQTTPKQASRLSQPQTAPPVANQPLKPSGLRNQPSWTAEVSFDEPAVGEDQSIYVRSRTSGTSFYAHAQSSTASVGTAH